MSMPFKEITLETALDMIEELEETSVFESTGATVHSGKHKFYGPIHIVIPIAGLSILMVSAEGRDIPAEPHENT